MIIIIITVSYNSNDISISSNHSNAHYDNNGNTTNNDSNGNDEGVAGGDQGERMYDYDDH